MTPFSGNLFPFLKNLDLPPGWEEAARRFLAGKGVTLVLGAPDTGKSTLCHYLIYRGYTAGKVIGWVDVDLGQSHLGPPTTLGLAFYPPRLPGEQGLFPDGLYFIGQTSPVGALLEVVAGTRILVDEALGRGVDSVVVNTSGLIRGPAAFRLKQMKVDLLQPALILALQRQQELAPLLRLVGPGNELVPLPVSCRALPRSMEERRAYRQKRFRQYFSRARTIQLPLQEVMWQGPALGFGTPLPPEDLRHWNQRLNCNFVYGVVSDSHLTLVMARDAASAPPEPLPQGLHLLSCSALDYTLVGLSDLSRRTLALGVVLPSSFRNGHLTLWTPLPEELVPEIRFLRTGRLKLSLSGQEIHRDKTGLV